MKKLTAATLTLPFLLTACGGSFLAPTLLVSENRTPAAVKFSKMDLNAHPLNKTVCDPFNQQPSTSLEQGIRASLHYNEVGMPRMYSAENYVNFSKKSDKTLFFADMNVPTRKFTQGFSSQTNDVLKDDNGNRLIEYFGIKFETTLKLTENDEEGDYEFALLSDDGAVLKVLSGSDDNITKTVLIDNDGDHPTRLGCAKRSVNLTQDSAMPIEVAYYQGPRYHISNTLLWRKASATKESSCGATGNNLYFDVDTGAPKQAFTDLLARGWKVVAKENFFIPGSSSYNPCVVGTKPVISDFRVLEVYSAGVILRWTTDIAASSQVKVVNKATGEVILTNTDNVLSMAHNLSVMGLSANTTYTAQAVSISDDLGNSLSDIIEFTTP